MSKYTYTIERQCRCCGQGEEVAVPLIEALLDMSIPFADEDIKVGIAQVRYELKAALVDYRKLVEMNPKQTPAYSIQYERVKDTLEERAAKLLRLRKNT